jgi:hypothetical protein
MCLRPLRNPPIFNVLSKENNISFDVDFAPHFNYSSNNYGLVFYIGGGTDVQSPQLKSWLDQYTTFVGPGGGND